jgi:two-component system, OmpR family, phosphate regulon sensor histidine kinase PhoR
MNETAPDVETGTVAAQAEGPGPDLKPDPQPNPHPNWGRLLLAALVLWVPVVLVLAALVLTEQLALRAAAIGGVVVLGLTVVMLNQHFRRLRALTRYLGRLRESADDSPLPAAPSGGDLLSPGLSEAIAETAREQRARRRDLKETMAMNAAVLAGFPDPLILVSENRRVLRVNPAAEALLGHDLAGRELALGIRNPSLLAAVDAVLNGGEQETVEFVVPGKVERALAARVLRLPASASQQAGVMIALYDLTGAKQGERMRADFVANVSHELRTPLSSLIGFIETLRGPAREDREARERFLKIMEEQSQRMSRLVDDLLSLSRIELQEHTAPSSQSDIEQILRSVASTLELEAARRGMHIEISCEDLPAAIGDRDELIQVFQNLLDNAVKYGEDNTVVRVAARRLASGGAGERRLGRAGLKISVTNAGEGIERDHIPRLTERFYRVDSRRSRRLGGTGLGLAIVKHIVNRHRGVLEIESRPNEGATFSVYLPSVVETATLRAATPRAS